ncbi:hypothetical protein FP2506_09261 [Fulvimarina pelagi HTCC2506]|uniref:Putative peptidoglycan binding domain-containing protein n=1 Tax=Fulvimarina pelagi HTCC2506 TaxID=314231 RepID=Q0G5P4_9HYPH|nr:DUF1028 domain-containing protein [Fulvimarina pelagi]EAU43020.1 hypothetical protein FP2506_09261 [Fulvimarina pelagi HTCC2506]
MTYSIIGHDPETEAIGGAVQSKFPGVASIVLHGDATAGMIHTQAFSNPDHGRDGLDLLRLGATPKDVISILTRGDRSEGQRQIAVMDLAGTSAHHTGAEIGTWQGESGGLQGAHSIAIGNSLSNDGVLAAMVETFERATGDLATRLIAALAAGRDAGGEFRGVQAAGVLVVKAGGGYGGRSGRMVDIQVYDHESPIEELVRCYQLHRLSYFPSNDADLVPIDAETAGYLRELLTRLDLLRTPSDDLWGEAEIAAMARFMGQENYDNRIRDDALIDTEVLKDIRARHG